MNLKREPKREISQGDHLNDLFESWREKEVPFGGEEKVPRFCSKRVF